jgi:hypothetical protein
MEAAGGREHFGARPGKKLGTNGQRALAAASNQRKSRGVADIVMTAAAMVDAILAQR